MVRDIRLGIHMNPTAKMISHLGHLACMLEYEERSSARTDVTVFNVLFTY